MYKIYADDKLLHAPHLIHEGCGVISPKLTVELNKAGSLEFTIPPNNILYDELKKLKTIITVYENDDELFRGRVLNDEKDFYKQKKTYCEGELAFLLDSTLRPYTGIYTPENILRKYIDDHNSRVEETKRFTVGKVDITASTFNQRYENYNYPDTLSEIEEKLINGIGGYIKTRGSNGKRYIDWTQESGPDNSQVIEFGINLLDLSEYITAENIYTIIIPTGATLEDEEGNPTNTKLSIELLPDHRDYIEAPEAISLFGRIEHHENWPDVTSAGVLISYATDLLNKNIEMAVTLSLNAVDLHLLNVNTERLKLGDWVTVISIPHGLNKKFQCTKIVYDLTNPDQTEYIFGVDFTSLTSQKVNETKNMKSSVSTIVSTVGAASASMGVVNQAANNINSIIAQIPTDYVPTSTFEAYKEEADTKYASDVELDALVERVNKLEGGNA